MSYTSFKNTTDKALEENKKKIYQVQGIKNTNKAIIRYIGDGEESHIKIFEKTNGKFKYVLLSHNISNIEFLDMLSLNIINMDEKNKNNITISLEFEPKEKEINKELVGQFKVYLNNGKIRTLLDVVDKYIGNNNIIEFIMKYIIDKRIINLFL